MSKMVLNNLEGLNLSNSGLSQRPTKPSEQNTTSKMTSHQKNLI